MTTQQMLESISERFRATAHVGVVYGDPVELGDKRVIPVATVSYMFGAGSGRGGKDGQQGEGGGGGGGLRVNPLGVIEISPSGTRFIPVVDANRMALLGIVGLFMVAFTVRRYIRFLEKRR